MAVRTRTQALLGDERGVALLEFAFVLPFLILLYIGGVQLMDGISAYRKVGMTVRTLADLTTQNTTLNAAQADEILNASQQVMAPYSSTAAVMRISQLEIQSNGQAKVLWSRAKNGTALTTGSMTSVPSTLQTSGSVYVFSEISYSYTPPVTFSLIGTIPLKQTIYMSPRNSSSIVFN